MGSGKTEAAITMMKENPDKRYIFITPYLEEGQRIRQSCPEVGFYAPDEQSRRKLKDFEEFLREGYSVTTTHALLGFFTPYTVQLIRDGHYTLVLDEAYNVIEEEDIKRSDFLMLLASGYAEIAEDGMHVRWLADDYDGDRNDLKHKAQLGNLIFHKNHILFWQTPPEIFSAFDEVYILTYMFRAQFHKYYFDANHIDFTYIGTHKVDGVYRFTDTPVVPDYAKQLINKVHILEDDKLNRIGTPSDGGAGRKDKNPLCSSWYKRKSAEKGRPLIKQISNNIYNVLHNRYGCNGSDALWTTYKHAVADVEKRGYKKSFLSFNARATNKYRDRRFMAYCVNVFMDKRIVDYFVELGATIDQDAYALSEMVQWIWRSAIRCGEDVYIYVPSLRMRTLLKEWLYRLSQGEMS